MDLTLYTGRRYSLIILVLIVLSSCQTQMTPQELVEQQRISEIQSRTINAKDPVNIKYKNNSSSIEYAVGKGNEEFLLDMNTDPKFKKDVIDGILNISREAQMAVNNAVKYIRMSQEFLYIDDYNTALDYANESIKIIPTAEGYALKGSILYMMGDEQAAKESWLLALKIDPEIKIPTAKELKEISSK
jgi:tetratricopeptide (TPR) repeat protein